MSLEFDDPAIEVLRAFNAQRQTAEGRPIMSMTRAEFVRYLVAQAKEGRVRLYLPERKS